MRSFPPCSLRILFTLLITLKLVSFGLYTNNMQIDGFYYYKLIYLPVNTIQFIMICWNGYQYGRLISAYKLLKSKHHILSAIFKSLSFIIISITINYLSISAVLFLHCFTATENELFSSLFILDQPILILETWLYVFMGWFCKITTDAVMKNCKIEPIINNHAPFASFYCKLFKFINIITSAIVIISAIELNKKEIVIISAIQATCDVISIICCNSISIKLQSIIVTTKKETFNGNNDVDIGSDSIFNSAKNTYSMHKYWIQNIIIILSCICTIIGASVHWHTRVDDDPFIGYTPNELQGFIVAVCCLAGLGLFVSILSITMECRKCKCYDICASDTKLRMLCVTKTCLLFAKQSLIQLLRDDICTYIFQILSFVSLLTIAWMTYAFDNTFTINLKHIQHPNLLYTTYMISYFITNASSITIVVSTIISQHISVQLEIVSLVPFIWLLMAKLYNNEFARFKDDVQNTLRNQKIKGFPTSIVSLYHLQHMVIVYAFGVFVFFIVSLVSILNDKCVWNEGGSDEVEYDCSFYGWFYMIQVICAVIMVFNGITGVIAMQPTLHKLQYQIPLLQVKDVQR